MDAYQRGDPNTNCLHHAHCPIGRLCVDDQCLCPPGTMCACFSGPPPGPATFEGDVLLQQEPLPECDAQDRCQHSTRRIDCASMGRSCDPASRRCTGGPSPDAGSTPDAAQNPDARSGPDATPPGERSVAADCPDPEPVPPGQCPTVSCIDQDYVYETGPAPC